MTEPTFPDMPPGWIDRINEAQLIPTEEIGGRAYFRIKYGADVVDDPKPHCRDCGVAIGQLHVPGCCVERCGKCFGQAITCHCFDDEEDDD